MKHITVVIKYEDDQQAPSFHANMECLGGILQGVMFDDALLQIEEDGNTIIDLYEQLDLQSFFNPQDLK